MSNILTEIGTRTGQEFKAHRLRIETVEAAISGKQATLVSGTNIKTINGTNILGTGDLVIDAGGTVTITTAQFTATAGQTTFNTTYTPQLIQVYVNGAKLFNTGFTATNGTSVVLNSGLAAGDFVEVVKFTPYNILPTVIEVVTAVLADKGTTLVDAVDYVTSIDIPFTGTITKLRARTSSGTVSVRFKRNGVPIGSLLDANATGVNQVISQAVTRYDIITVDLTNSLGSGLTISMEIQ